MVSQILAAIAAIPKLISVIEELVAMFKKAEQERWFEKSNQVFTELKPGTTSEQKAKSAQEIQDLIKGL